MALALGAVDTFRDFDGIVELNAEMLMKTDTLQDSLEKYRQKIAGGGRNRASQTKSGLLRGRHLFEHVI